MYIQSKNLIYLQIADYIMENVLFNRGNQPLKCQRPVNWRAAKR